MHRIDPEHRRFASALRQSPTDCERLLWRRLRERQLDGCRFRRQFPIGVYVVDFVCLQRRLIVELDGGQHDGSLSDAVRDAWLGEQGFRVLRFWNNEVLTNIDGVLERVMEAVRLPPPPRPSPVKGEGETR